jgi:hypothetical protein
MPLDPQRHQLLQFDEFLRSVDPRDAAGIHPELPGEVLAQMLAQVFAFCAAA